MIREMPIKKRKKKPARDRGGVIYAPGIGVELVTAARAKCRKERWPLSEVVKRLLRLWLEGKAEIG